MESSRADALEQIEEKLAGCRGAGAGTGPGTEPGGDGAGVCAAASEAEQPVVLDADGINALAGHIDVLKERRGRVTILTPHDGEFARLGGRPVLRGPAGGGPERLPRSHGCTLVLKGPQDPDGRPCEGPFWSTPPATPDLPRAAAATCSPGSSPRCWPRGPQRSRRRPAACGSTAGRETWRRRR